MTPRLRLGYPTRLLDGPLRDKLYRVASFGATGVQLDLRYELRPGELSETGRRQFGRLLDEHGLSLAPPVFPLRRAMADLEGIEERVAAVGAAIRFAAELKASTLIVRPGAIPPAESEKRAIFVEVVNDLARIGNHVGVMLVLTTGREAPGVLSEVLQNVSAGPVGVNLDPAAAVMAGQEPARLVTDLHALLRHVRVRDGLQEADGAGVEVPVGRGEVDWEAVLASLAEVGYDDWFTPDRTNGDDPARDAAQAIVFVKNVMPF